MTQSQSDSIALHTDIPPEAPAALTIDLRALRKNYRIIKDLAADAACAAVVKADAYGIGARQAVPALVEEGCDTFFIATPAEARLVREIAPNSVLYGLDGLLPETASLFAELDLRPVLSSVAEVEEWAAFAASHKNRLTAALHIDTGMNRLGLRAEEIDGLARDPSPLAAFDLSLIVSHLACSDEPDNPKNQIQRALFDQLRAKLADAPASLANSGGVFLGPDFHYDMVRPGIALFGGRAAAKGGPDMHPVVHLSARILQVKDAELGETVGYGATRVLERKSRVAIIAAGYADGYFRSLSSGASDGRAFVYLGNHKASVLGRVSMDLIAVDVTDVPEEFAKRGGFVELLGAQIGIDDLADIAGTIGYEILTNLGPRFHRIYREA